MISFNKFYIFDPLVYFMDAPDEKLRDSQHYRKAMGTLDNFERMMELVKKYPIKSAYKPLPPSYYSTL